MGVLVHLLYAVLLWCKIYRVGHVLGVGVKDLYKSPWESVRGLKRAQKIFPQVISVLPDFLYVISFLSLFIICLLLSSLYLYQRFLW